MKAVYSFIAGMCFGVFLVLAVVPGNFFSWNLSRPFLMVVYAVATGVFLIASGKAK